MIRVLADANVLISAGLARDPRAPSVRVFDAALDGRIELVGFPALLAEVASVLGRPRPRRYLSLQEAQRFVADLPAVTTVAADSRPPHPAVCRDAADDYLVPLARATRSRRSPVATMTCSRSRSALAIYKAIGLDPR